MNKFYHGTPSHNLNSILSNGFGFKSPVLKSVSFALKKTFAMDWGMKKALENGVTEFVVLEVGFTEPYNINNRIVGGTPTDCRKGFLDEMNETRLVFTRCALPKILGYELFECSSNTPIKKDTVSLVPGLVFDVVCDEFASCHDGYYQL